MSEQTLEERIAAQFDDRHVQFLLDDVGIVKFHHFEEGAKRDYGILETQNGDALFFTQAIHQWRLNEAGSTYLERHRHKLEKDSLVTFRPLVTEDGRLRCRILVPWQPEWFDGLLGEITAKTLYRMVQVRPLAGGVGDVKGEIEEKVVWDGWNLEHLRQCKPKDRFKVRVGEVSGLYFQQFNRDTGQWEYVDDPR